MTSDESAGAREFVVLGDPIAHSLSPAMHRAAFACLGLSWKYDAVRVAESEFSDFVAQRGPGLRGASVTHPLKRLANDIATTRSALSAQLGVANTLLFTDDGTIHADNTDVEGICGALTEQGSVQIDRVAILGGGATALSAGYAAKELGVGAVTLHVRQPRRAAETAELLRDVGIDVLVAELAKPIVGGLVISALPPHAADMVSVLPTGPEAVLLDVAYEPWPSHLAMRWRSAGGRVVSGKTMLAYQGVAQTRLFRGGQAASSRADDAVVLAAMKRALGL